MFLGLKATRLGGCCHHSKNQYTIQIIDYDTEYEILRCKIKTEPNYKKPKILVRFNTVRFTVKKMPDPQDSRGCVNKRSCYTDRLESTTVTTQYTRKRCEANCARYNPNRPIPKCPPRAVGPQILPPSMSGVPVRLKAKLSCHKSKQVLGRYQSDFRFKY
jgi:hypothetical protein